MLTLNNRSYLLNRQVKVTPRVEKECRFNTPIFLVIFCNEMSWALLLRLIRHIHEEICNIIDQAKQYSMSGVSFRMLS